MRAGRRDCEKSVRLERSSLRASPTPTEITSRAIGQVPAPFIPMDSPDSLDRLLPATLDLRIDHLRKEIAAAKQRRAPTLDLEQALLLLLGAKRRLEQKPIQPSSQGKSE